MKAMILAAGLGTRLRPLTDDRPKALVKINGRTLLEITLERLATFGIREVIINVHHFADMIVDYLKTHQNFGMEVEISREEVLLDTGGGMKKAAWFFLQDRHSMDQPFVLHNVDVLSSIDLGLMLRSHQKSGALATLAVMKRESSRQLLFDGAMHLCGRRNRSSQGDNIVRNSPALEPLAFSGVHVISPRLLGMIQRDGVFSIIETYLQLAGQGENIAAFRADEYYWRDLGKLDQVEQATLDYQRKAFS
ncbi:MAG TPA: nucleotidyltransferase family protein [Candidatus Acidoferrum sp.]